MERPNLEEYDEEFLLELLNILVDLQNYKEQQSLINRINLFVKVWSGKL